MVITLRVDPTAWAMYHLITGAGTPDTLHVSFWVSSSLTTTLALEDPFGFIDDGTVIRMHRVIGKDSSVNTLS